MMDESAPAHVRRPGRARGRIVNQALATLVIDALLVAIGLGVLSSVVPPADAAHGGSVLAITPGRSQTGGAFALTTADLDAITRSVPGTAVLSRVVAGTGTVGTGAQAPQVSVLGVDPSYALLPQAALAAGAFFTLQDATAANRVAILGPAVAASLFPNSGSSVGQTIHIRNQPFVVVGVLASRANAAAQDSTDNTILIPFQTSQIRLFGGTAIDQALLGIGNASQVDAALRQIEDLLRQRHRLAGGQPSDFTLLRIAPTLAGGSVAQLIERALQFSRQYGCTAKGLCGATRPGSA